MIESRIDFLCDRYESALDGGLQLSIEALLEDVDRADRSELVDLLLQIDIEHRIRSGAIPEPAGYFERFAEYRESVERAIRLAFERCSLPVPEIDQQSAAVPVKAVNRPERHGGSDALTAVVIRVVEGPDSGKVLRFTGHDTFVAGRARGSNIRLASDPLLSRHHCRFEIQPPHCLVIDLNSSNGTEVNGKRIEQALVSDGDVIRIGSSKLEIEVEHEESDQAAFAITDIDPLQSQQQITEHYEERKLYAIPGYELGVQLGHGGMGAVYRGTHLATQKPVAIKIMHPALEANSSAMQRFVREASMVLSLKHKRIVDCREFGLAGDSPFLVMEFIEIESLEEVLNRSDVEDRVRIAAGVMTRVLEGLQFAHERQIVHRDLKPTNLLTFREGRKLQVKLADFGLAKNFQNAGFGDLTKSDEMFGTVAYMPPEQIINCRYAKPSCDIYSAGVCLYKMLTDQLPFQSSRIPDLIAMILDSDPIPIHEHEPQLPSEIAAIVRKALDRQPEKRFQSAAEMGQALVPFTKRSRTR